MRDLADGELDALRNLQERCDGTVTPFLNIADARVLTELGLASRTRQGWEITVSGRAHLADVDARARRDAGDGPTSG